MASPFNYVQLVNPSSIRVFMGILCLIALITTAHAQDLDQDNDGIPDTYEKGLGNLTFADAFNLQGMDNSAIALNAEEVQLTQDQRSLRGSAMSFGMIDLMDDFSFTIEAYFGVNRDHGLFSTSGADGIAIVFHYDPSGSFALGVDGEGIGAQGIRNGLVLEIDTYGNGDTGASDPMRSAGDNHTDIWDSDDTDRVSLIGGYRPFKAGEESPLEDGTNHEVVFTWISNTGTLSFTVDGERAGELSLGSAETFINTYFAGSSAVHFGFTASTGAARNEHRVRIVDMESLPVVMDTDGDGIYDHLDLDSDNDGIYDADEAGHGAEHINGVVSGSDSNGDGIPDAVQGGVGFGNINYELSDLDDDGLYNHQDLDADGDGCSDVAEMGYSDQDRDGSLGSGVPIVDENGVVVGESGYTVPTDEFLDPNQSTCQLATDLGDDGDGNDVYVTFYEDNAPLDLMADPQVLNMEDKTGVLIIETEGVTDGSMEHLQLGDWIMPLSNDDEIYSFQFEGVSLNVEWQNQRLSFQHVSGEGITVELIVTLLDQLSYHHTDTISPSRGERTFNVVIDDGTYQSATNWVIVMVEPVNDLPFADTETVTLNELNAIEVDVLSGDFDLDGQIDSATIEIVKDPGLGSLLVNSVGTVIYTPDQDIQENDVFRYTVKDNNGGTSNEAVVTILLNVATENEAPVAANDYIETQANTSVQVLATNGLLSNDIDENDDNLSVVEFFVDDMAYEVGVMVQMEEGMLIVAQDGSIVFTPESGYSGTVSPITYVVSDGDLTDSATLEITVIGTNQPPVANDSLIYVNDLTGFSLTLSDLVKNTNEGLFTYETLEVSLDDVPGTLSWNEEGEFTYLPEPGFVGNFTVIYQVCNDQQPPACDEAQLTIHVNEMDSDGDGTWDHEEDTNQDQDLSNDDCDQDNVPNYLDADTCQEELVISSVVTNNGDHLNDYLSIRGIEQFSANRVSIFNRWGNIVWEVMGYDNTMDNKRFQGAGKAGVLPDGTYFYVINKGDNSPVLKGFLTLKNH